MAPGSGSSGSGRIRNKTVIRDAGWRDGAAPMAVPFLTGNRRRGHASVISCIRANGARTGPACIDEEATMADSIKSDVEALREDLNALRSDIGSLAATMKDLLGSAARSAGNAAEENVEE